MLHRSLVLSTLLLLIGSSAHAQDRRVFESTGGTSPAFGGPSGADARCDAQGKSKFGATTHWVAWIASMPDGRNATDLLDDGRFIRATDNAVIATSIADLTDGTLGNSPLAPTSTVPLVWTGANADGTPSGLDCNGWTTASGASKATLGVPTEVTSQWTFVTDFGLGSGVSCTDTNRLHCFEVAPPPVLDCTGRNIDSCVAVNDVVAQVNSAQGRTVLSESAAHRLRPTTLYTHLERLRVAATTNGCGTAPVEGWAGGDYDARARTWSGSYGGLATGDDWGTLDGVFAPATKDMTGDDQSTPDVGVTRTIGDSFSHYRQGKFGANHDDGFMMGHHLRVAGTQGVFVALHGSCDPTAEEQAVFSTWFGSDF